MFFAYMILAPIVALALVGLNWLLATSNSYTEKDGPFECGFTSYQQSRSAFSVSFILVAILFLPFDLEISSILPYTVTPYINGIYGLYVLLAFLLLLITAFRVEIGLNALKLFRKYVSRPEDVLYIHNN